MRMKILIVDDDQPSVKMITYLLKEEGHAVSSAKDGQEALDIVERESPDLIIMDVMMPRMDGLEATRRIRQIMNVPIIILSAKGETSDKVAGLQLGADDYLAKPFEPAELLARVHAVLRRSEAFLTDDLESRVSVSGVHLDPVEHNVILPEGAVVPLTTIEFKLLHCLMRNAGRVVTPSYLLNAAWGYDYEGESNQIAVYVRRLRNKIEKDPNNPRFIVTVRRLGYRFTRD
jgi:DNA-binding response OmpR family regulator